MGILNAEHDLQLLAKPHSTRAYDLLKDNIDILNKISDSNVLLIPSESTGYQNIYYAKSAFSKAIKKINKELGVEFKVAITKDSNSRETKYLRIIRTW